MTWRQQTKWECECMDGVQSCKRARLHLHHCHPCHHFGTIASITWAEVRELERHQTSPDQTTTILNAETIKHKIQKLINLDYTAHPIYDKGTWPKGESFWGADYCNIDHADEQVDEHQEGYLQVLQQTTKTLQPTTNLVQQTTKSV